MGLPHLSRRRLSATCGMGVVVLALAACGGGSLGGDDDGDSSGGGGDGGTVRIGFDAGMADQFDGLNADLRQAVMLLAAHYYEYRDDTGLSAGCMPFGVTSLIERYRNLRLLGGGMA